MNIRFLLITIFILLLLIIMDMDFADAANCMPKPLVKKECCLIKYVQKKSKKNIVSVYGHKTITGHTIDYLNTESTASATIKEQSRIIPGIMYQYIFDNGFVPMIGLDNNMHGMIGVGFNF